ncbi:MAG: DUF6765 family protein [Candidatus Marinimicrobia bacterium]|nr:DUF6765 family protein [Candidatus Neomarinimicrobiota bacterium]
MNVDCHYYAVLALCRMLGYRKEVARTVAYSSQFVDDAQIKRIIFGSTPRGLKCHIFGKKPGLERTETCPKIMFTWNYRAREMIGTLVPFHFIPGGRGRTFQEKMADLSAFDPAEVPY